MTGLEVDAAVDVGGQVEPGVRWGNVHAPAHAVDVAARACQMVLQVVDESKGLES